MRAEWRRRGLLAAAAWLAARAPAPAVSQQPQAGVCTVAYGGSGPGREGQILPFNVRVSVQVLKPDEPLR